MGKSRISSFGPKKNLRNPKTQYDPELTDIIITDYDNGG